MDNNNSNQKESSSEFGSVNPTPAQLVPSIPSPHSSFGSEASFDKNRYPTDTDPGALHNPEDEAAIRRNEANGVPITYLRSYLHKEDPNKETRRNAILTWL
jgi:hypothetical protein